MERIYRSDQYLMKEEAVQQLEEEFEFADKELRQLQLRAEGRKRRDLESLRRFGIIFHRSFRSLYDSLSYLIANCMNKWLGNA